MPCSLFLFCSIQVLGTPTREQIREMNPNYTEFKFPQIKAHPWTKVSQQVQEALLLLLSSTSVLLLVCVLVLCACHFTAILPRHIHPTELDVALTAPQRLWAFRMTKSNKGERLRLFQVLFYSIKLFLFVLHDSFWAFHHTNEGCLPMQHGCSKLPLKSYSENVMLLILIDFFFPEVSFSL